MNIAILIPVCSRGQKYSNISDIPFLNKLYPSFLETKEVEYSYTFFIGFDDDDEFYNKHVDELKTYTPHVYSLKGCQHAPAWAWNKLAEIAYNVSPTFEYFFQVGDDIKILTPGWTTRFINKLKSNNNLGVVGPCNMINYLQRVRSGRPPVIENSFVSRKHIDIFGYYFYPSIKNWFCDDWISRTYDPFLSEIQTDILCENSIIDVRYSIQPNVNLKEILNDTVKHITTLNGKHVFSYCIFGTNEKYCKGMLKNLVQIKDLFPLFEIWIHCGNDVPKEYIEKYNTFKNVKLIHYDITGGRLMSHRFFTIDSPDVSLMIVRDADSRFEDRDIWCMKEFIKSSYNAYTIRDHQYHNRKIMGGQWGMKKIKDINIQDSYETFKTEYKHIDNYRSDQDFIDKYIYNNNSVNFIAFSGFYKFEKETTVLIGIPRKTEYDFCGNVVLFDKDGNEYYEFKSSSRL